MSRLIVLTALLLIWPTIITSTAQDEANTAFETTIFERLSVYAGPGDTYEVVGILGSGVLVSVDERNPIGTWLHINRPATDTTEAVSGWVLSGYLNLPEDLDISTLPTTDLPPADLDAIENDDLRRLYTTPTIPTLSDAMITVFERGQDDDNQADVVSKIGDSNTANPRYLEPLGQGQVELGAYRYLQPAVDYFGPGFDKADNATRVGLNTFSVFDPFWSNPTRCEPDEYPLQCEFRVNKPALAVIMFGQNDTRVLNTEQWEEQMRRIIEETLAANVIPALVTFSSADNADVYQQTITFNLILLDLADEYEVPVINLWAAARALPNRGIGADDAHLTGGGDVMAFTGREARDGVVLLNLLVLATLEDFRQTLPINPD